MVQTAGLIRSNEEAFLSWVRRSVRADLYVTSGGPISSSGQTRPLKPSVAADIEKELPPGSELVGESYRYPDWEPDNRLGADSAGDRGPTTVYMILADARKYYEANRRRPEPPPNLELWKQLAERPGVALVSENFARMHRVKVGDSIQLKGRKGLVRLEVIGAPVDYSWIRGTIFVDRQRYRDAFGADEVNAWEVYLPAGADVDAAREKLLRSRVTADHALLTATRQEVHDGWSGLVRRIYGVAYTQEVVVAIVAIFGVVTSLLISVLARRRELGLLRAVGGTRGQLLQTVLAEAVFIGVVGTLLGVLLGLPLEWYVVRVVLFEETGFLFPMRIPWAEAGIIAALAVLSATLAGLGPALQAMRLRIADAVAYE
jgi:putative ABC transport system permease protein